ncbi:MAG: carboxypeptidase regulatory-like domain-containing protein, partial [Candidatus Marinimicrobia bacterium]|nr:carboxypeptidase regulatory-like domain-containing protein [Candidatus Neomarinimicrobiota bacterium]
MNFKHKKHIIECLITLSIMILCNSSSAQEKTSHTVGGNVYLEEQTDHSGAKVKFTASSPSAVTDSTYTPTDGSYSIILEVGIYNVEFSKEGYISNSLTNYFLSSDTTLPDVTLQYGTVVEITDTISGTLTNEHVYRVVGDLIVPDTSSLTINPGVKMMFAGDYDLNCYGPITAIGT